MMRLLIDNTACRRKGNGVIGVSERRKEGRKEWQF
jgi:hypothetical protein